MSSARLRSSRSSTDDDDDSMEAATTRRSTGAAGGGSGAVDVGLAMETDSGFADSSAGAVQRARRGRVSQAGVACGCCSPMTASVVMVICACVCLTEAAVAASWGFVFGIVLGGAATIVCSATAYVWLRKPHLPYSHGRLRVKAFTTLLHLAIWYCCMLLVVRALLFDRGTFDTFPASCRVPGCARVTGGEEDVRCGDACTPPEFHATLEDVQQAVEDYIDGAFQAELISVEASDTGSSVYTRGRFLTTFVGFADDFGAVVSCDDDGVVRLDAQFELRLGGTDFGQNLRRMEAFVDYMRGLDVPNADCRR